MIVVVGATGSTGPHLVRELVSLGAPVRAAARDTERARAAVGEYVPVVQCDLTSPETFGPALRGAESVYVSVGGAGGSMALVELECRFIDYAKKAGIRHYVKVSGIGSRPNGASKIERMHGQICEHLIASGVPYTILEPSFFMQNFLGLAPAIQAGVLPLPTGDGQAALIDSRDIAATAARVLTSRDHFGGRYILTGPELLSHGDAAAIFSRVLERPVKFQDVPQEAFEGAMTQAGLPGWFANLLADVYGQLFKPGRAALKTDWVERIVGKAPRGLPEFVRDHRAAFLG